jgi:VWFA-related protein
MNFSFDLKKLIFAAFLLHSFAFAAFAQDDVVTVDTTLVRLNVGVVDQKGNSVTNLSREDFAVYEDGVKQQVLKFEPVNAPFSVVLLLDTSGSTLGFRQTMTQAASRFIDALGANDRVLVASFSDKIELLTDFTTNRKDVFHAITVARGRGKTQFYKALNFSLEKLQKEGKRRKAIVVLTDGVDTDLRNDDRNILNRIADENQFAGAIKPEANETLNKILNAADKQGVTVYPLALPTGDPFKLADPTPLQTVMFSIARERLQILANRTGGRLNTINRLEEMSKLYAAVAADLRTLYSVEYESSSDRPRDGKWRTIRLELNRPELVARTRPGYYAR